MRRQVRFLLERDKRQINELESETEANERQKPRIPTPPTVMWPREHIDSAIKRSYVLRNPEAKLGHISIIKSGFTYDHS